MDGGFFIEALGEVFQTWVCADGVSEVDADLPRIGLLEAIADIAEEDGGGRVDTEHGVDGERFWSFDADSAPGDIAKGSGKGAGGVAQYFDAHGFTAFDSRFATPIHTPLIGCRTRI